MKSNHATSLQRLIAFSVALAVIASVPANAADISSAIQQGTTTINTTKSSVVTLGGAIIGLVGTIFLIVYVVQYIKSHQIDALIKIGVSIIAMSIGVYLIT